MSETSPQMKQAEALLMACMDTLLARLKMVRHMLEGMPGGGGIGS